MREHYHDASAQQFEDLVAQAPKDRLVLVDFKAVWCGPCKFLTPLLEKVVPKDSDIDRQSSLLLTRLSRPLTDAIYL